MPVVHIQHVAKLDSPFFVPGTPGVEIRPLVKPLPNETLIQKNFLNAFRETKLLGAIRPHDVKLITAAMRRMPVAGSGAEVLGDAAILDGWLEVVRF